MGKVIEVPGAVEVNGVAFAAPANANTTAASNLGMNFTAHHIFEDIKHLSAFDGAVQMFR